MKFKKLFAFTLLFSLIFAPNVFADCSDYSEEDYDYIVQNSDPSDLDLTCSNGTLFTDDYLMRIESALTFSQTVPNLIDPGSIATPNYFVNKLSITPYQQSNYYYCGPANVKMIVQYLNGTSAPQSTYASYMNTDSQGQSYVYQVTNALNYYTSKTYNYVQGQTYNSNTFATQVQSNIQANKPIVLHAWTQSLYMYNGVGIGHYLTVNGYTYSASFGSNPGIANIYYVDPYYVDYGNGSVYGEHMDTTSNVFNTVSGTRYIIL